MSITLNENIFKKYKNNHSVFIETGTYKGGSVQLASDVGFQKIYSIDISIKYKEELYDVYKKQIQQSTIELLYGESYLILDKILTEINKPCLIWLDAHYDIHSDVRGKYECPILQELEVIKKSNCKNHTILIDDLRIFRRQIEWGHDIHIEDIEKILLEINPNYSFLYEDGWEKDDILVAMYA